MPQIFKALASITVWILFVTGCLGIIFSAIEEVFRRPSLLTVIGFAVGVATLTLSVVVMRLRQIMD